MTPRRPRNTRLAAALAAAATVLVAVPARAQQFGDVEVLATVPTPPGSPEGIAVAGDRFYVAGPARFGTILSGPSSVLAFDLATGNILATYPTQGENLLAEHGNSCLALDAYDRLYVLNTQLGVYRLDPATGVQQPYGAPFPNLPACGLLQTKNCSPTLVDLPPLPNDIVFDADGDAYVTDSMQATIWKLPAGGGAPQIWFQDLRLASPYIGVNGVRLDPTREALFFTVTTDLFGSGYIYTLPLVEHPGAGDLAVFHAFAPGEAPDGLAFGASGDLYVTLALPTTSGVAIFRPDGTERTRLVSALLSPTWPYDSPANVAFDDLGSLLVVNHAFATNLPSHFNVLRVFVDDIADPLETPRLP